MKRILLMTILTAAVLAAADVTGKWRGQLIPEDRDAGPALLVLKQEGELVTGTGGPKEGELHEISNGRISGDKLTFEIATGNATMKFALTVSGEDISGDVSRERDGARQTAKLSVKREK